VAGCAPRRRAASLGWLAATGAMAFLVVLAFAWAGGGSTAAPVPSTTTVVRIQQGETLWDVARQYAPDSRADQVVAQIEQLNSLADDAVYPGELVRVPSSLRG
jgi:nucleoid-associated protein YgaU